MAEHDAPLAEGEGEDVVVERLRARVALRRLEDRAEQLLEPPHERRLVEGAVEREQRARAEQAVARKAQVTKWPDSLDEEFARPVSYTHLTLPTKA